MNKGYALQFQAGLGILCRNSIFTIKKEEILISPVNDSGPINSIISLGLKPRLCDTHPTI